MTFFSEAKFRFKDVPEDGRIEMDTFLKACCEIVPFFGKFGQICDLTNYILLKFNVIYRMIRIIDLKFKT